MASPKMDEQRKLLEDALNRVVAKVSSLEGELRKARTEERRLRRQLGELEPSL